VTNMVAQNIHDKKNRRKMMENMALWASLLVKGVFVGLCGLFWRIGGQEGYSKAIRRIVIPALLGVFLWGFSAPALGYLSLPLMWVVFSLGYGESSSLTKLLKNKFLVRFVCGLLYALSMIPLLWGNWYLLGYHVLILSTGVMLAGNQKFKNEDIREEFFIGCLIGLCPMIQLPL